MTNEMDGIVLSKPELLVLLDAVGADVLLGVDSDELVPDSKQEHQALVLEGIEKLKDRDLLEVRDEVHVIETELMMIGGIFAEPELAILIRKVSPAIGEQLFYYYQAEEYIIEHTMPEPGQFRFATIPNTLALINRIDFLLPTHDEGGRPEHHHLLDQELYKKIESMVEDGRLEEAETLLEDNGFTEQASHDLVASHRSPEFMAVIGLMRCEDQSVIDARELVVVKSEDVSWLIHQDRPGEPELVIRTTGSEGFRAGLFELLRDLVRQA